VRHLLNVFLLFVPATLVVHFAFPEEHTLVFFLACAAIIPLAGWMGKATEHLAERCGEGVGSLLNATFGNAAELIIAIVALRKGLTDIVKASLTGSIIGNILLVMGAAFLAGGLKHPEQRFNASGARTQATMLTLAAVSLVSPAIFHHLKGTAEHAKELSLSFDISIVLLVTYALGLLFTLRTHRHLFDGMPEDREPSPGHAPWSIKLSLLVLGAATALVAWTSEILIGSVEHTAESLGMSQVFIGVIVVAVVGNAAEHSTAILVAMRNRMDLSLGIAIGSSIQIALFVAPLLVLLSYAISPEPMDLVFSLPEVLAVAMAVLITDQIAGDGESNWLEGVQLLAVYSILGILFYFL
jgi:Ca2+:H+ antiporter